MAQINDLVKLLNILVLSSIENTIMVDKTNLIHVRNCVQEVQGTIEFLHIESHL